MAAPASDQVEVSVFGPGFGECSVVHLGSDNWVIIDSCLNSETNRPVAIEYLNSIGVDLASSVKLVIVTHWHDDHIRGLPEIVRACSSAHVCMAMALRTETFLAHVIAYDNRHSIKAGSGVSAILEVMKILRARKQERMWVVANRVLLDLPEGDLAHGYPCRITALSPSDAQSDLALEGLAKLVPTLSGTKKRFPAPTENHLSIATWISIGEVSILMGGDLEEQKNPALGWSAVLNLYGRPTGRAQIFKIPHHGSKTGHHDDVWSELLQRSPFSVLTPWEINKGLPTPADVKRIVVLTPEAYSTSSGKFFGVRGRDKAVEKQIRISGVAIESLNMKTGHVRFRNGGKENMARWEPEVFAGACKLEDLRITSSA